MNGNALLLMLLLRVAGISLKYELKVLAIGSGSLTMITLSRIEVFVTNVSYRGLSYIGPNFFAVPKDDLSRLR